MPAAILSFITPPPQLWKISGGVPPCRTVANLVLKASFSRMVILILTFGWAAIYSLAMVCQRVLPGSMVVICHHSMVTFCAGASVAAGACVAGASVAAG